MTTQPPNRDRQGGRTGQAYSLQRGGVWQHTHLKSTQTSLFAQLTNLARNRAMSTANGNHTEPVRKLRKVSVIQLLAACYAARSAACVPHCRSSPVAVLLSRQVFLIFGKTGWIGGLVGQYLKEQGAKYEYANCRLEDRAAVISEIERVGCCSVHHASAARPSDCVR